jgi:hypothetical protein
MQQWEYATAPLISHALQEILNNWGDEGYELVTVVDNVAYFTRPKHGCGRASASRRAGTSG